MSRRLWRSKRATSTSRLLKNARLLRFLHPSPFDVPPSTPHGSGFQKPCIRTFLNSLRLDDFISNPPGKRGTVASDSESRFAASPRNRRVNENPASSLGIADFRSVRRKSAKRPACCVASFFVAAAYLPVCLTPRNIGALHSGLFEQSEMKRRPLQPTVCAVQERAGRAAAITLRYE